MKNINLHTEISRVASELYDKSGCIEGRDLENWLAAEKFIIERYREQGKIDTENPAAKKTSSRTTKKSMEPAIKKGI
jgi:Protein of unknown function (DUF2934)